ncbi:MAG: hypothetical protein EOO65_00315 [Methanosarcinales archaeon]|nr:MAG: hypothetical protein EOO65_00315 [Methanosarcinales archaeon]
MAAASLVKLNVSYDAVHALLRHGSMFRAIMRRINVSERLDDVPLINGRIVSQWKATIRERIRDLPISVLVDESKTLQAGGKSVILVVISCASLESPVLWDVVAQENAYTGINIRDVLDKSIKPLLRFRRLAALVADNARTADVAIHEFGTDAVRVNCLAHSFQLCFRAFLDSFGCLDRFLRDMKAIVSGPLTQNSKRGAKAAGLLLPNYRYIQGRWTSATKPLTELSNATKYRQLLKWLLKTRKYLPLEHATTKEKLKRTRRFDRCITFCRDETNYFRVLVMLWLCNRTDELILALGADFPRCVAVPSLRVFVRNINKICAGDIDDLFEPQIQLYRVFCEGNRAALHLVGRLTEADHVVDSVNKVRSEIKICARKVTVPYRAHIEPTLPFFRARFAVYPWRQPELSMWNDLKRLVPPLEQEEGAHQWALYVADWHSMRVPHEMTWEAAFRFWDTGRGAEFGALRLIALKALSIMLTTMSVERYFSQQTLLGSNTRRRGLQIPSFSSEMMLRSIPLEEWERMARECLDTADKCILPKH